jgi:hypothetical protein
MIRVRKDGQSHDEAHVDGAATMPFFVPSALVETPVEAGAGAHRAAMYVIIDGPLGETARATRLTARAVFSRSVDAGLHHVLLTTLELTAATAQLQGVTLRYAAIPSDYPLPDGIDFHAETMRPLLRYAYQCTQSGRLWTTFRRIDDERKTEAVETPSIPCPADDELVRFIASR